MIMRWFLLPMRAKFLTQRFLSSQQYHQRGGLGRSGSGSRFSNPPNTMKGLKSIVLPSYLCQSSGYVANLQPSSLFLGHQYGTTSGIQNSTESLSRVNGVEVDNQESSQVDLQIISRETVKPASPTPDHLRTFSFSILDQFYNFHTPLVLFLPNADDASVSDVITKRSKLLKESLSELLIRYYPFAGEIKDDLHIECNDKGVDFVEARVNQTLKDFLRQPDDQKLRQLVPKLPAETESSPGNYVLSVQVNIFDCGGIGLSTRMTHKIIDGDTYLTFMDAWAATARGSADKITPSFLASKIFPNNPSLSYPFPKLLTAKQTTTKIFVFDSTALYTLKAQLVATATATATSPGPTRVEATGALIWKAAAKAASTVRQFSPQSPHALLSFVNFRKRASPPLPRECIGNLIIPAMGICYPDSQPDLATLMRQIRESIAKINPEFVEALKGEKGHQTFDCMLKKFTDLPDVMDGDVVLLTSLLNSGIYQIDFGWGKPIWFYYVNPGLRSVIALNDTVKGGGVEASVTLSPEEMQIFEHEPDILTYASVNPSPLQ